MEIYDFTDYKTYLLKLIELNSGQRGYRTLLSEGARCQKSYFSKVINSNSDLSSDQAMALAEFLNFDDSEADYLLELVSYARAATEPLKKKIKKRIEQIRNSRENLSKRFKEPTIDKKNEINYYSSWLWSAIHIIVELPEFQTPERVSLRLNVSVKDVKKILIKLKEVGLVKKEGTKWILNSGNIHLPSNSPHVLMHHQNWRQKAIIDSHDPDNESIHYTVVQSHSIDTLKKNKKLLLKDIDKIKKLVKPSRPEEITCVAIDFFRV